MDRDQRRNAIAGFSRFELTDVAETLFDSLIQAWEEALTKDTGLQDELYRLSEDGVFANYLLSRRREKSTRGVDLIHALQDLRLIAVVAPRYPILASIHLDRD